MPAPISHWYHIYASGNWEFIYDQHYFALESSGLLDVVKDSFFVGIVGSPLEREKAHLYLKSKPVQPKIAVEADEGWEQETLDALLDFARSVDGENYVFYAHTKGSSWMSTPESDPTYGWRTAMTYWNVKQWREVVGFLDGGSHMAGCHWMRKDASHPYFFGGNFWWTKTSLMKHFSNCGRNDRWQAETWIGSEAMNLLGSLVVTNLWNRDLGTIPIEANTWNTRPATFSFFPY